MQFLYALGNLKRCDQCSVLLACVMDGFDITSSIWFLSPNYKWFVSNNNESKCYEGQRSYCEVFRGQGCPLICFNIDDFCKIYGY